MVPPADPICVAKRRNGSVCNLRRCCMFLLPRYLVGEGLSWYLWEHKSVGSMGVNE